MSFVGVLVVVVNLDEGVATEASEIRELVLPVVEHGSSNSCSSFDRGVVTGHGLNGHRSCGTMCLIGSIVTVVDAVAYSSRINALASGSTLELDVGDNWRLADLGTQDCSSP